MSRRGVSLEGKHDQMVMFTLVELMTHLIFLALILGFALRKEADVQYQTLQPLVAKCGTAGEKCAVIPPALRGGKKQGGIDLPNCLGSGSRPVLFVQALGNGGYTLRPATDLPAAVTGNPAFAPLLRNQTLTREDLNRLAGKAKQSARAGTLGGGACIFYVSMCRTHRNIDLSERQSDFIGQFFYPSRSLRACGRS